MEKRDKKREYYKTKNSLKKVTLPEINQKGMGRAFKSCLECSAIDDFQPMVIWRAGIYDGTLYPVLLEIHREYNRERKEGERKYLSLKRISLDSLKRNEPRNLFRPEVHKGCLLYLDKEDSGLISPRTFKPDYGALIFERLKHLWETEKIPVILLLPFMERPEAFEGLGFKQLVYRPDFEEWRNVLKENQSEGSLDNLFLEFIESVENEKDRDYRWYWYYHRDQDGKPELHEGTGCDFPSCWTEGLSKLHRYIYPPLAQIPKNYKPRADVKISEIPYETFRSFFEKGISSDLIEAFRNYLIEHKDKWEGRRVIP